ncbi:hypothetical protein [Aeromonas enteropelogenes]|uniref:hypothetical protein n=1 Tax=Aeromonas enteropelogenes TaxID=29489 RepID=UPI003BA32DF4
MSSNKILTPYLIHFSFIQDEVIEKSDLISGLLPLFAPLLDEKNGTIFNSQLFSEKVKVAYGLDIHPYVSEHIAIKMISKGWLKRDNDIIYHTGHVEKFKNHNKQADLFDSLVAKFEETHLSIYPEDSSSEINFADDLYDRMALNVLDEEQLPALSIRLNYSFSRFIISSKNCPEYSTAINELYAGILISQVILSLKEPASKDDINFKGTTFIIDTPVLLSLLGLHGPTEEKTASDFISLLSSTGAILTTTDLYKNEVIDTVRAALENYRNGGIRKSKVDRALFLDNKIKVLCQSVLHNFDSSLKHVGLSPSNIINVSLSSVKAKMIQEKIYSKLNPNQNTKARDVDARCITTVVINNATKREASISKYKNIFISSNQDVINRANSALIEAALINNHDSKFILSERKLATLLWLKIGDKSKKLDATHLLSSCLKVTNYIKFQYEDFLRKIDENKENRMILGLLNSDTLLDDFIDITHADTRFLRDDNIQYYLDEIINKKAEVESEKVKRAYKQKVVSIHKQSEDLLAAAQKDTQQALQDKKIITDERNKLIEKVKHIEEHMHGLIQEEIKKATNDTRNIIIFIKLLIILLFTVLGYFNNVIIESQTMRTIIGVALGLLMTWVIPDEIFNKTIGTRMNSKLEMKIEQIKQRYQME